jgi:hypothetical protein
MLLRPPALFLAFALCACAGAEVDDPPSAATELPPIPFCRDEMIAYVQLIRLARAQGDGWTVFAPAMTALRQQIVDCVEDADARFHPLRLTPAPPPPARPPEPCGAGCASARPAARQPA